MATDWRYQKARRDADPEYRERFNARTLRYYYRNRAKRLAQMKEYYEKKKKENL